MDDYLPFTSDGTENPNDVKFIHHAEIFNGNALELSHDHLLYKPAENSFWWQLFSDFIDLSQTLALMYLWYRIYIKFRIPTPPIAPIELPVAEASSTHYCKINDDLYTLLYIIIFLCLISYVPKVVFKCYRFIKRQFNDAVDTAAEIKVSHGVV